MATKKSEVKTNAKIPKKQSSSKAASAKLTKVALWKNGGEITVEEIDMRNVNASLKGNQLKQAGLVKRKDVPADCEFIIRVHDVTVSDGGSEDESDKTKETSSGKGIRKSGNQIIIQFGELVPTMTTKLNSLDANAKKMLLDRVVVNYAPGGVANNMAGGTVSVNNPKLEGDDKKKLDNLWNQLDPGRNNEVFQKMRETITTYQEGHDFLNKVCDEAKEIEETKRLTEIVNSASKSLFEKLVIPKIQELQEQIKAVDHKVDRFSDTK